MTAYYNEFDPYAAQWLRNLIEAGHIAPGVVDERSIEEVQADELREFTQCHFFAGIGGWSLAARLAGWPDDQPLWTGSCPCQPFSAAGKQRGTSDERHLWPVFFRLIQECRPAAVAGEQVASRLGRDWLAGVRADLEGLGYAVGGADLCAAGVGAPHIRQRLWWVADAGCSRSERGSGSCGPAETETGQRQQSPSYAEPCSGAGRLDDAASSRRSPTREGAKSQAWDQARLRGFERGRDSGRLADTRRISDERGGGLGKAQGADRQDQSERDQREWSGADPWRGCFIYCADGKARRIEPSIEPLAHGISNRVGRLRAYGNAIVPQVAAEVLKAFMASEF